jgi:nucleoside-diphosphate-sugar epimerase
VSRGGACLITGATGFIGGHLARRLASGGQPLRCLVRAHSDTSVLDELDVELVRGELTDPNSLGNALEGCRYVVHCGALVSDWATVEEIRSVNIHGTRSLLEAARAGGVRRFVHLSTTDVYGHPGGPPVDEDYAGTPLRNWYSRTKRLAEAEVRRAGAPRKRGEGVPRGAAPNDSLETVIIRPATVYGPRSRAVIAEIAQALRGRNMLLIDHGRAVAGLCYVENLVDLVVLALYEEASVGEAFNASDGLEVTWKQLTNDLASAIGAPPARWSISYALAYGLGLGLEEGYRLARRETGLRTRPLLSRQAVQVLGRDQRFSNRKAKELLGWEPGIGYAEGLEATLDWLHGERN